MKKILVVSMSAELGGIEKSLINFLRYLEKCDCTVDLMLWKKSGELLLDIPRSVNIIDSPAPGNIHNIIKQKSILKFIRYLKLKKYTRNKIPWKSFPKLKTNYDIAIAYSQDGYTPYYVIDNVDAEKKYLWYHHGDYVKSEKSKELDEQYYKQFNKILTVSQANKELLCQIFPNVSHKFDVVLNLIDEDTVKNAASAKCSVFEGWNECKITTVGRLAPEKGQLFALDVAEKLRDKNFDFKWCFVGDGPDYEECLRRVREKDLGEVCVFVGAQINPYSFIASADIYTQLSFVESYSLTVQEAMIINKPIIASDIPVLREALCNGFFGWNCNLDAESAANKIIELYNDEEAQEILCRNMQNRVSHNMLMEQKMNDLFELIP